ncbi:glycoside hydrolase family 45 protein [Sporothrix schenckii 1099-18]|uniref:cellulase n=1 Tax=Sporothrix schenckii 1099-18 TaxID=1397361 RepID=A0A0F2M9W0_SPOSC|nr:glycoside hydrolase family 45 protein [Sporothrix schenckii 1099-18]KJR84936.1 glycoside hydrolase family 45 protein [Sporothrix schenckii 1099-18]
MLFKLVQLILVGRLVAASVEAAVVTSASSYTGWDCCKPICANGNRNSDLLRSRGVARTCDKDNRPQDLNTGLFATTGCSPGGSSYMCDSYQPVPVADDLSYGFAIQVSDNQREDNPNCCKCYEVQWLSGAAAGKKMIVQIVTPGGAGGSVVKDDLIILTPGGGLGYFDQGCPRQYGSRYNWYVANGDGRSVF